MNKLLAIVRREYVERVRTKAFLIGTLLAPVLLIASSVVPALMMSLKSGDATRLAIVDQTGKLYEPIREAILRDEDADEIQSATADAAKATGRSAPPVPSASYEVERVDLAGRSLEDVRGGLNERVGRKQLDGYIIIPPDVLRAGTVDFRGRNTSDLMTISHIRRSVSDAVVEERFREENIDAAKVKDLRRQVELDAKKIDETGAEKESGGSYFVAFGVGLVIYFMMFAYGSMIFTAVIEDKTTRISEVLFSSTGAFYMLLGKLIGISLVALTQFGIWLLGFLLFTLYGVVALAQSGVGISLPALAPSFYLYVVLYFLLGFFIYATLYALIGSMVTTVQEGQQLATPIVLLLMSAFFLSFAVLRAPSSTLSFWASMVPFFSPITMLTRIVTETPPFWQIALSLILGYATVIGLVWLAARVYRTGMLMYGKRATFSEAFRWVRQS